jgi:thiol:disulfide interchange protein
MKRTDFIAAIGHCTRPFRMLVLFFTLAATVTTGQILQPVHWKFSVVKVSDTESDLVFTATVDKGYHIYAMDNDPNAGPIPTSFSFVSSPAYVLSGKMKEGKAIQDYDPNFDMQLKYFEGEAVFRQRIRVKGPGPFTVKGTLTFMVCDDSKCLPPEDVDFSFGITPAGTAAVPVPAATPAATVAATENPEMPAAGDTGNSPSVTVAEPAGELVLEPGCGAGGDSPPGDHSLLGIFIAGMLGGFLALLTPCVFPMIPLTVSFFTKRSGSRRKGIINALIYAASIVVIYVLLGFLVTVTLGSDALNDLASNGFFNLAFFIIFIIFAISFFGAFEITLPSSIINKADSASDRGGLIGIFFMAFTLSLVSFSCTGPIIGTLLVEAAHGRSYLGPITGMSGFAVALALPFALFAAFPGWLNTLPKSGGWLNSVKVSLGFLELALALKFLSNVDLAYHWGFLRRELFVALWVVIFVLWGLYLLGRIRFHHDSEVHHLSIFRLVLSILVFTFALYLAPGIWGAPLKLISGFPPPEFYKEWKTSESECPHDLSCFHDYDEGMRYARTHNKPVMIDFTGWSCVNCRKMEDNVWSDAKVLKRLANDYVLISLYVDDKEPLPEAEQYVSQTTGKKIRTVGNKWSDLQASTYQTNSQPYYVLLDNRGRMLARPRGYTPEIREYLSFLEEGLCRNSKRAAVAVK